MTANINPETGIAYGYISADSLHPDVVQTLQDNGTDVYWDEALSEAKKEWANSEEVIKDMPFYCTDNNLGAYDKMDEDDQYRARLQYVRDNWDGSRAEYSFSDNYQPDEPIHEGEYEGVKYRTSWLGGALHVWVFFSPFTARTVACSPCVPNAGDLDNVGNGDYECYDVPPDWRDQDE